VKTKGARSQIGAAVTHLREGDESENCFIYFVKNAFSGVRIVSRDKFPDFR
jgi:hypothetical protein